LDLLNFFGIIGGAAGRKKKWIHVQDFLIFAEDFFFLNLAKLNEKLSPRLVFSTFLKVLLFLDQISKGKREEGENFK
jgi:hypothetical protein